MVDEFWRLQRQRVGERELADAQAYLTGSFPLTIETPSAIALQVLNAVFFGLDLNELQTYPRARQRGHGRRHPARRARRTCTPIASRSCSSATRPCSRSSCPASASTSSSGSRSRELDLGSADLQRHGPPASRPAEVQYCRSRYRRGRQPRSVRRRRRQHRAARADRAGGRGEGRARRSCGRFRPSSDVDDDRDRGAASATPVATTSLRSAIRARSASTRRTPAGPLSQVFDSGTYWVAECGAASRAAPDAVADQIRGNVQRDAIGLLLALADGQDRRRSAAGRRRRTADASRA